MSAQSQKASRWGNFLSSVESRLDTILAEDDPKAQQKPNGRPNESTVKKDTQAPTPDRSISPARPATPSRAQERLNERLARAVANKHLGKQNETTPSASEVPSRTGSPANAAESPRPSAELQRSISPGLSASDDGIACIPDSTLSAAGIAESQALASNDPVIEEAEATNSGQDSGQANRPSVESSGSVHNEVTALETLRPHSTQPSQPLANGSSAPSADDGAGSTGESITQLREERDVVISRWKEESQELLEKIDALQAKLLYLTREAGADARTASSEATAGSPEQKLADKDERIALLIEEGQKLSQTELKHMNLIKRLRAKAIEDEKSAVEARKTSDKFEKSAREALEKAKRAAAAEKQASDWLKGLVKLEKDFAATKNDRDSKDDLIRDLQFQLSDLTSSAKQAEEKARADALEQTRKRAIELEDNLSNMKAEKEVAEREHQNVLREIREKGEREKERAKVTEVERQGELSILESRLEAYRARAEEVSAGQGCDLQAKLLRQIETLQNQYAVASENWQGIEGSLVSRVAVLEKERDEIAKREAELRRKAREANTRNRRLEEELERTNSRGLDLNAERSSLSSQMKSLQEQLNRSEEEMNLAKQDFQGEREDWESRQAQRMEEERTKLREEFFKSAPSSIFTQTQTQSPILQMRTRRSSNAGDLSSPQSRRVSTYQGLGLNNTTPTNERPVSRHSSAWVNEAAESKPATSQAMNRTDSMSTVPNISINNGIPETPSIDYDARHGDDDFFGGMHTPTTPPERTINDLVSASTAAGPSVQLVERMSAAVRRLESEKAAHKDELARLVSQRDESREQVVELMQDNEGKRAVDARLKVVETEFAALKRRHETTLEMLGEKSERVEELKADIVDLKAMMREMVEERVK